MRNRKDITKGLTTLLARKTGGVGGIYGAWEVALDWGASNPKFVDYMTFDPASSLSISGIEKGIFTCYEIKSCYEDLYSGNGLNFIGEKNYLVTTMDTYKRIIQDQRDNLEKGVSVQEDKLAKHIKETNPESRNLVGHQIGVMVAVPSGRTKEEEFSDTTPYKGETDGWELQTILNSHRAERKKSLVELLFCMMRSR